MIDFVCLLPRMIKIYFSLITCKKINNKSLEFTFSLEFIGHMTPYIATVNVQMQKEFP